MFSGSIFFLALDALLVWAMMEEEELYRKIFVYVLTAMVLWGIVETIFNYVKYSPSIEIDEEKIIFNGKDIYYWENIESIHLHTKKEWGYSMFMVFLIFIVMMGISLFSHYNSTESVDLERKRRAILLCFKDEKRKFIFHRQYSNTPEIISFLQQIMAKQRNVITEEP
ncbi:MAG: hypothetical protein K0Q79_1926 [Flavipsychrobacter sp.]|jgi:hypothetical protein|nr:hypothetical protein [Flavipsychrobacter sp.]